MMSFEHRPCRIKLPQINFGLVVAKFIILRHINLFFFPSFSILSLSCLISFAKSVDGFSITETPRLSPGVSQVRQPVQLYVKSRRLCFHSKIVDATRLDITIDEREQQKDWLMHAATNSHFHPKLDVTAINREIELLQVFFFLLFYARDFIFSFVTRAQNRKSSLNSVNIIHNTYRYSKPSTTQKTLKH